MEYVMIMILLVLAILGIYNSSYWKRMYQNEKFFNDIICKKLKK
jgi:uncharacterized membrane protein